MVKITQADVDTYIIEMAYAVRDYLTTAKAVRLDAGHIPGRDFICVTRESLEQDLEIPMQLFPDIKRTAWELGISLCMCPGQGHYLSMDKSEIVTTPTFKAKYLGAMGASLSDDLISLCKHTTLEEADQWSRRNWGYSLTQVPRMLEGLGAALPPPIKQAIALLTASK